jgi:hypothetical protein
VNRPLAFAVALLVALSGATAGLALSDRDANELAVKTLTASVLTKAAIGQLLFEGLLAPQPGTLAEIVQRQGGLRAKAAFAYLKLRKVIPADYGRETVPAPVNATSRLTARVEVPDGVDPTTISAYVTGLGLHYGIPRGIPLAGDATASVPTGVAGAGFLVVRGPKVDIACGGDVDRIRPREGGHPWSVLEKSRLEIKPGEDRCVQFLFPFTGTPDWGFPNLVDPKAVRVARKRPGKAHFLYFAENSRALSHTLIDPNQPIGKVEVVGDFNNWSTDPKDGTQKELFDDGGMVEADSTDAVIGDGVYARTLDLPAGTHGYALLINGSPNLTRDPYEEGSKIAEIKTRLGRFKVRVSTITVE